MIKHTSSSMCSEDILTTEKDEKGKFRPMKTTIRSRFGINLFYYLWYKSCRLFYLTVYYYFFPMMIIQLSLQVPVFLISIGVEPADPDAPDDGH